MGDSFLGYVFVIYLLVSIVALKKWYDLSKERELKELVAWSVTGDYSPVLGRYSFSRLLWLTVIHAQSTTNIPKKYRIDETEEDYCLHIISEYQTVLARKYFLGELSLIKSKYAVHGDVYFMSKLHDFLADNCDEREFLGHKMFETPGSYSEFAIAYHKLFLITYMYCKSSPIINPDESPSWMDWEEKSIREVLDSKPT